MKIIHHFADPDGEMPFGTIVQGSDGALYGSTIDGVLKTGVVFKVNPDVSAYQVLHRFAGPYLDGANAYAGLIQASDGALYGTTKWGGANLKGTIYKLNPDGSAYQVLHSFEGEDGAYPVASVIQASDGALYGTTSFGGSYDRGVVYRVNTDGTNFQVLYSFTREEGDGAHPYSALLQAVDGALYGTTFYGGLKNGGVVYRVNPDGSGFKLLHSFEGEDGAYPVASVIQASDGALYGTASQGGARDRGVVFNLNPDGTNFQVLHSFAGEEGAHPEGGVIQGLDGALYGAAKKGGPRDKGTIYRLQPDGSGYVVLHRFEGGVEDGAYPIAGVIHASDGALYGATVLGGVNGHGVIYKINPF